MREDAVHHNKGVTDKVAKESCKRGTVMTDVLFGVYFGEAAKAYKKIAVTAGKHIRDYEAIPAIERTDEQGTGVFDLMREALEKPAMLAQDMSKMYLLQALLRMFAADDNANVCDAICAVIGQRLKTGDFVTPLQTDFDERKVLLKLVSLSHADAVIKERRAARDETKPKKSRRGGKKAKKAKNIGRGNSNVPPRDYSAPKSTQQCRYKNNCRDLRAGICEWKHTEAEKENAKKE